MDAMMRELIKNERMTRLPEDGWIFVPVDQSAFTQKRWANKSGSQDIRDMQAWGLSYHVIRTHKGFLTDGETTMLTALLQRILIGNGWSTGAKAFTKSGKNRNGIDSPHFGTWSHYAADLVGSYGYRGTKDMLEQGNPITEDEIKRFLSCFQLVIAPKLCKLLRRLDPLVYQVHQA
jgi:hypothetical protein